MSKKYLLLIALLTLPQLYAETVSCDAEIFKKNACNVCYQWGTAEVDDSDITLPETIVPWENKSATMNHNIYKSSQNDAEIFTDFGDTEPDWHETALVWWSDITWATFADLERYTLVAGKKVDFRKIEADTKVSISNTTAGTDPILIKIPIKYHEIATGSFSESAEKTSNYCVSYTPQKVAESATAPAPSTTPVTAPVPSTSAPKTTAPAPAPTPAPKTTAPVSAPKTTTVSAQADTDDEEASATNIDDEIPTYNAKVTYNSAPANRTAVAATRVPAGPVGNMFILLAAIMLSVLLYPKISKAFNR